MAQDFPALTWANHICRQLEGSAHSPKGKLAKYGPNVFIMKFVTKDQELRKAILLGRTFADLYMS